MLKESWELVTSSLYWASWDSGRNKIIRNQNTITDTEDIRECRQTASSQWIPVGQISLSPAAGSMGHLLVRLVGLAGWKSSKWGSLSVVFIFRSCVSSMLVEQAQEMPSEQVRKKRSVHSPFLDNTDFKYHILSVDWNLSQ